MCFERSTVSHDFSVKRCEKWRSCKHGCCELKAGVRRSESSDTGAVSAMVNFE